MGTLFLSELPNQKKEKKNKYNSTKKVIDGIKFDSMKEANRYVELKLLQRAGKITNLELQKEFELIPTQREPSTFGKRGGEKLGAVIEKKCSYYADFCYNDENGNFIVEDTKGKSATKTTDYIIKRKLMLYVHGIRISEI